MKRRLIVTILTFMISMVGIFNLSTNVKAETMVEDIDMSSLMTDTALIGYAQGQTWGVYFSDGHSIINRISSSKLGAGGVTNAAKKCTVQVTAILERKNSAGAWARVTSWTQTNQNAYSAMISKSVTVSSGYYYRVRCYHYASTDTSSSFTNALYVGN